MLYRTQIFWTHSVMSCENQLTGHTILIRLS
jgi:hypothetical protein